MNVAEATVQSVGFLFNDKCSLSDFLTWWIYIPVVLVILTVAFVYYNRELKQSPRYYTRKSHRVDLCFRVIICTLLPILFFTFIQVLVQGVAATSKANNNFVASIEKHYNIELSDTRGLRVDNLGDKSVLSSVYFTADNNPATQYEGKLKRRKAEGNDYRIVLYVNSNTNGKTDLVEYGQQKETVNNDTELKSDN